MINMFLEDTPDCLTKIESAINKSDHGTIQRISHKMKPSMGFMGMSDLEKSVAQMEKKAEEKQPISEIGLLFNQVKLQCEMAFIELRQELKRA